ncbi:hypothetical protein U1Q18_038830, partial [Sarracenia purpurea var. burkii]
MEEALVTKGSRVDIAESSRAQLGEDEELIPLEVIIEATQFRVASPSGLSRDKSSAM